MFKLLSVRYPTKKTVSNPVFSLRIWPRNIKKQFCRVPKLTLSIVELWTGILENHPIKWVFSNHGQEPSPKQGSSFKWLTKNPATNHSPSMGHILQAGQIPPFFQNFCCWRPKSKPRFLRSFGGVFLEVLVSPLNLAPKNVPKTLWSEGTPSVGSPVHP